MLVNKQEGKKPNLEFWKDEVMELGFKSFVSVSHDGDYVIAQVILEEMS